ncbi:response regulator with CheY-like receiver, AAA-type ATPase, and DNA-binding domains [Galbibacter orientalis DSM 19592]|uniref:Response regulator with CheY-like receiver, AAA-type ATPase, and DNA-binding domains n=1 Tax=Galbibacter orientalis DSM 19592 TaxID=926559 RepID=I3C1A9_9FLAO|nr:sigma-54 dependent transcriptional regulator [Galbibacter orientalis]EIJ37402.1 response regulator with CheY-like receiver, AAA-type ATPase, and DNA-binding domains [Galbibacter orientalis DSM 19592]
MAYKKENILIVDDDIHILELLQRQLEALNYYTFKAVSVKEAVTILKGNTIDLLVTDLQMPEVDGFQLIQYVSEHYSKMPVLVVSGYISAKGALEMGKSGVVDYLVKPFTKEELKNAIDKSLVNNTSKKEVKVSKSVSKFDELIGESEAFNVVKDIIERVKDIKATVLIQGESGTGKELIARAIHYNGKYARAPFIAVNCGAIPENLLEAELFGYEKGAFTGANESRNGFFQAANGGTIFLDEIGNASAKVQNILLRVLQEKEIIKVGAQKAQPIDIRVVAATNSNLLELVTQDKFRQDLFYRLAVVEIKAPPLRNRKTDIPLLVDKFVMKYGLEYKDRFLKVSPEALDLLLRYSWPGNIRELENCIQRAVIMSDKSIELSHIPDALKYQIDFPEEALVSLAEMEKKYIKKVLDTVGNNKTKAAEILGIDRKTLRNKMSD